MKVEIEISGSKSISNRLLVLNALYGNKIDIVNLSDSDDARVILDALSRNEKEINIHHAGTAMRFLTSYFSCQEGKNVILTGSDRMKQRPIKILVEALQELGADIQYIENEGFPPLKISGKKLNGNQLVLDGSVSSQYITSLCLIGSKLENGLTINLQGKITSLPYIKMTIEMMKSVGISVEFEENQIVISNKKNIDHQKYIVESDWSSVSYHYEMCAFLRDCEIEVKYFFEKSLQGDKRISQIYKTFFGVETIFKDDKIILKKNIDFKLPKEIKIDMNDCPDLAQTVAVTAFGLKIPIEIFGLETLKIKETDRLQALKNELEKLGATVEISENRLKIKSFQDKIKDFKIETYNDHRMAMSFAPLVLFFPIEIQNQGVVTKSYLNFWKDMQKYKVI